MVGIQNVPPSEKALLSKREFKLKSTHVNMVDHKGLDKLKRDMSRSQQAFAKGAIHYAELNKDKVDFEPLEQEQQRIASHRTGRRLI